MEKKKETNAAAKKAATEKNPAEKKAIEKDPGWASYVGKELTIKVGKLEYKGVCTGERATNSGIQVYLKIAGEVARYFNEGDIV